MPYIYGLSNDAMPGLIKIGAVHIMNKTVEDRMDELYTTGVAGKFTKEFFAQVSDSRGVEKKIHAHLEQYRYNGSREFFQMNVEDAKTQIQEILPGIEWCATDSLSNPPTSKSAYIRLNALHTLVMKEFQSFLDHMKQNGYHDMGYSFENETKCKILLQRLMMIQEGLIRMNEMDPLVSPYRKEDNAYMKQELHAIQIDVAKMKDSIAVA